ncbi:hypothetical protein GOODEAATRI_024984 [Goodea atripinnis]|uniref:Uncharacterized protein n=1 Tax=Goodea atripinnis TaxID=208336 RepID=A0ABV0PGV1_9TELE
MAAWLSRRALSGNSSCRLPLYLRSEGHVCSRGVGRTFSALQDKLQTVEDLPRVSSLEMIYRFIFQGYYYCLHELQTYLTLDRDAGVTSSFLFNILTNFLCSRSDPQEMFSNSMPVAIFPKWSRNLLPYWGRYIASWDGIFSFRLLSKNTRKYCDQIEGKILIDKKMEEIQQRVENNQTVEGEYLTYLLSNTKMSTKDVYASVTELLLAGVDTVLNSFL